VTKNPDLTSDDTTIQSIRRERIREQDRSDALDALKLWWHAKHCKTQVELLIRLRNWATQSHLWHDDGTPLCLGPIRDQSSTFEKYTLLIYPDGRYEITVGLLAGSNTFPGGTMAFWSYLRRVSPALLLKKADELAEQYSVLKLR
jgi:hypothetical protein